MGQWELAAMVDKANFASFAFSSPGHRSNWQIGEGPTHERAQARRLHAVHALRARAHPHARSPCARTHALRARGPLTPAPLRWSHPNPYGAQAIHWQAFPCVIGCLDWALGDEGIRMCA